MRTKYRVVKDDYRGFEVQSWRWWFPFWTECGTDKFCTNTHASLDEAREFIKEKKRGKVLYRE